MSLKIENVSNENMLKMVKEFDKDQNGELGKEEYSVFQKVAQKALEDKKISEKDYTTTINNYKTGFIGWLKDDDKVCTDTKDDGEITTIEEIKYFSKGFFGGILKNMIQHPLISLGSSGAMIALGWLYGPCAPLAIASICSLCVGCKAFGDWVILADKNIKTDGDTKSSMESLGTGFSYVLLSFISLVGCGISHRGGIGHSSGPKNLNFFMGGRDIIYK